MTAYITCPCLLDCPAAARLPASRPLHMLFLAWPMAPFPLQLTFCLSSKSPSLLRTTRSTPFPVFPFWSGELGNQVPFWVPK